MGAGLPFGVAPQSFSGAVGSVPGMQIEPVSVDVVRAGRDGRFEIVDRDLTDVARQLKEIHSSLELHRFHLTGHYSVVQRLEDGQENLVATCKPIPGGAPHPGLVPMVRKVVSAAYDPVAEVEQSHAERRSQIKAESRERVGERAEQAYDQLRKATGADQSRVYVP